MVLSATLRMVLSRMTTSRLTTSTARIAQRRGCPVPEVCHPARGCSCSLIEGPSECRTESCCGTFVSERYRTTLRDASVPVHETRPYPFRYRGAVARVSARRALSWTRSPFRTGTREGLETTRGYPMAQQASVRRRLHAPRHRPRPRRCEGRAASGGRCSPPTTPSPQGSSTRPASRCCSSATRPQCRLRPRHDRAGHRRRAAAAGARRWSAATSARAGRRRPAVRLVPGLPRAGAATPPRAS